MPDSRSGVTPAELRRLELFQNLDELALAALAADVERVVLREKATLFLQGDPSDAFYVVLDGLLRVAIDRSDGSVLLAAMIRPGEPVGEIQALSGGLRTASVYALCDSELVRVPAAALARLIDAAPAMLRQIAGIVHRRLRREQLLTLLPRLCGPLDDATLEDMENHAEWVYLRRGERLFRQGDPGDSLYVLIGGRLRAVAEDRNQVLGEIAPGESVGEVAVFTGQSRTAGVYAIRDSVLVRFAKPVFEDLMRRHPQVLMQLTRMALERFGRPAASAPTTCVNLALVPADPQVPLTAFAERLVAELAGCGPTLHLNAARLDSLLDTPGAARLTFDDPHSLRLGAWLDEQEVRHRFVVYEAEANGSPWTRRCIRQADLILLVARSGAESAPGPIEATFADAGDLAAPRRLLALIHTDARRLPAATRNWLDGRALESHHHLRWDDQADFGRLARRLAGQAVGVVLGGGGARGFAHVGVLRALSEAGIPIDVIGGTSMGAVIAAQYAMGWDFATMLRRNRKAFIDARLFKDYTLPLISLVSGRRLDAICQLAFGETRIEDLWIDYFCVSSNLTTAEMVVHRQGPLWKSVRASSSIPGIVAPVLEGRHLLVDGALFDNLPGDVMRRLCDGRVIVVDVGGERDLSVDLGRVPSPWEMLGNRLLPFRQPVRFPGILDVLMRATVLASARRTRQVHRRADLCLMPPVNHFGLLEFEAIDEIAEVGYRYAREALAQWRNPAPPFGKRE